MSYWYGFPFSGQSPFGMGFGGLLLVLVLWELYWKGRGLWLAAERKETAWFVAMLVLNTLGILPLLYLYVFSKKRSPKA